MSAAAAALAGQLKNPEGRPHAIAALLEMGPVSEKAVRTLLDDPEANVQVDACIVLERIGTADSLDALEKLAAGPDGRARRVAAMAIAAIKRRGGG